MAIIAYDIDIGSNHYEEAFQPPVDPYKSCSAVRRQALRHMDGVGVVRLELGIRLKQG